MVSVPSPVARRRSRVAFCWAAGAIVMLPSTAMWTVESAVGTPLSQFWTSCHAPPAAGPIHVVSLARAAVIASSPANSPPASRPAVPRRARASSLFFFMLHLVALRGERKVTRQGEKYPSPHEKRNSEEPLLRHDTKTHTPFARGNSRSLETAGAGVCGFSARPHGTCYTVRGGVRRVFRKERTGRK